tara:strand:+ start:313 stop:837 length:525 start_codon:yes stop_codon:yes gene_type:complete
MPNWCMNKLTITHEDKSMLDKFEKAYRDDWTIETFYPTPRDPNDPTRMMGENESISKNDTPDNNWYLWRLQNWGTKWDIGCKDGYGLEPTRVDDELSITFDSAWSPPLGFYERLVVLGFDVQASYFEPGMSFAGIWHNGIDEFYEGTAEDFPEALVDEFDMQQFYPEELEDEKM